MGLLIAAICVIGIGLTVAWFSPLRAPLLQSFSGFSRFKFSCRVELLKDETLPAAESEFLCVQMAGRIPTPCDNFDTDVRLEIEDVTGGLFHPEQVLSVDPAYRRGEDPVMFFQAHNGCVPKKNAVLPQYVTIVTIPCHVLRFAYRGRRKLSCKLSVLSRENGDVLVSDQQTIEYVYCVEGYRQIQDRKLDIFKSSVQLAMAAVGENACGDDSHRLLAQWLGQVSQNFKAAGQLIQSLNALSQEAHALTVRQIAEPLLAFGEQADRLAAFELVLQSLAADKNVTCSRSETLCGIAELLEIRTERFLILCQKYLLLDGCRIEDPAFLLGVDSSMDQATFRARLNEEYRKWNSRVTHPDKEIRRQADRMLTLIADLRTLQTSRVAL